jgi:hypothetical protein
MAEQEGEGEKGRKGVSSNVLSDLVIWPRVAINLALLL